MPNTVRACVCLSVGGTRMSGPATSSVSLAVTWFKCGTNYGYVHLVRGPTGQAESCKYAAGDWLTIRHVFTYLLLSSKIQLFRFVFIEPR